MQVVGFYCSKSKGNKQSKVKEIQIDVDKVKKDTNKALNSFINSLKKEGENNE